MASDKSTSLLQSLANTTMIDMSSDAEPTAEDAAYATAQYFYYAVIWKILMLLWDLAGAIIQVRFQALT